MTLSFYSFSLCKISCIIFILKLVDSISRELSVRLTRDSQPLVSCILLLFLKNQGSSIHLELPSEVFPLGLQMYLSHDFFYLYYN